MSRLNAFTGSIWPIRSALDEARSKARASSSWAGSCEDLGDDIWSDALLQERPGHRPATGLARAELVVGHLPREGGVIDQPHAFEPAKDIVNLLGLEPGLEEAPFELPAAARTHRQEPERALMA